jgi:hypothetical protein
MSLHASISKVTATAGGDGSTFISIEFVDGSRWSWSPDLPYDSDAFVEYTHEHGERIMRQEYDDDYRPLPAIPHPEYN